MIEFRYDGNANGLVRETKTGWARGALDTDSYFVHGSGLAPANVVQHRGLSPSYAREYLIDPEGNAIGGGKMIFTFFGAGIDPPANFSRSPAVKRLWGDAGHVYIFKAPAGANFYAKGGTVGHGKEVAFAYIIEEKDIAFYIPPGSKQNVPWKAVKVLGM